MPLVKKIQSWVWQRLILKLHGHAFGFLRIELVSNRLRSQSWVSRTCLVLSMIKCKAKEDCSVPLRIINAQTELPKMFYVSHTVYLHFLIYNIAAKSLQSCPTLCDPIDGSPPGSPVPGILQARTLEWAAISFSNAWKWRVKVKSLSRVLLLATPWTAAFSRQENWSGLPLPSPY